VQGSRDGVSTPDEGDANFGVLDGPRSLIAIQGANHFGITNNNPPQGAVPDFSPQTISQTASIQQISHAMGEFLNDNILNLSVSTSSDRSNMTPLKGTTLSGNVSVFLSPVMPDQDISQVDFFLDGSLVRTEFAAPYDLRGAAGGVPRPLDTRTLANGAHTVRAEILFTSGEVSSESAMFDTANTSGDDDDDDGDDDDGDDDD
ncbi:MAG: Ig-like domain-containing protein, partial [Gammaproteobacteria bacterium]